MSSDIDPATSAWIEATAKDAVRQIERLVRDVARDRGVDIDAKPDKRGGKSRHDVAFSVGIGETGVLREDNPDMAKEKDMELNTSKAWILAHTGDSGKSECLDRALDAADYMANTLDELFGETTIYANEHPDLYRAMCGYQRFVEAYRKGGLEWETK